MGAKKIEYNQYERDRLCKWLRDKRIEKNLSRRKVADKIGVFQTWVQKVETGVRRLEVCELISFCEALGVSPKELMNYLVGVRNYVNETSPKYIAKKKKSR